MIRFRPSSLMANYSEIKRVVPPQSRLVMVVEGNWKVEGWKCITEVRGRTGKLRREVVGRLDEENTHENKIAQDHRLCLRSIETLKVRPLGKKGLPE